MHSPGEPAGSARRHTPAASDVTTIAKGSEVVARTFVIFCLAATGMAALLSLLPAAGHDQMWLLYAANLVRHGTRLYGPHLFESNPPLIVWLSVIPDVLAAAVHLPSTVVAKALTIAIEAGIWFISRSLLSHVLIDRTRAAWWKLGFAYIAIFAVMPARDFGQRDQLLAVLCLPYLLAAAIDMEGLHLPLSTALSIGFLAGIGFALKPHHLLVVGAVEAALVWHRIRQPSNSRRRLTLFRPELLAIGTTCIAYYVTIRVFTPDYISTVLPILRETYWAIGHLSFLQLAQEAAQLYILATATLALYFTLQKREIKHLVGVLLIAGFASLVAYNLQGTGWYYQQIPALSFFGFALWLELTDWFSRFPWSLPRFTPVLAGMLSVLALSLAAYFSGYRLSQPLTFPSGLRGTPDPAFFRNLSPGTPVAILTTEVDDSIPPIFMHHLDLALSENNLWTMPAILRNEIPTAPGDPGHRIPPDRLSALDRMQHQWMTEDFEYWHPKLVLIERCQDPAVQCQILEDRHDNLLAWFLRDPDFRAIFSHYRKIGESGPFDAYVPD